MSNPSYIGLLKIGMSDFDPVKRKSDLESTGVPDPFKIEYYALVDNHRKLEHKIHNTLKEYRHRANREFFNCDIYFAIETIRKVSDKNLKYEENNVAEQNTFTLNKVVKIKNNVEEDTLVLDNIPNKQNNSEKDYSNLHFPLNLLFKHKNLENKKIRDQESKREKPSFIDNINIIVSLIIFSLIMLIGISNDYSADVITLSLIGWGLFNIFYMLITKTGGIVSMIIILAGILLVYFNLEVFII